MNNKQPKYLSIKELFSTDDYVIPIYQRNYDWGESEITQLIQDIVDYLKNNENKTNYYIGSLIVYERKTEKEIIYEIIDGQQRITTLTILLSVIKKEYTTIDIDLSWYNKLNLYFDCREVASNTLLALFNGENLGNKECNVAIKQGYDVIQKSLNKILKDNKLTIEDFCNYLFNNVKILRIPVPEDTNLNHYFEIMNTRGEQLEKHEILKANMLQVLEDENLKYAFNLIWEATSNMEKYVQYGFSVGQRKILFGDDWNKLVDEEDVYNVLQNPSANQNSEETLTQILKKQENTISNDLTTEDEGPERFNSVINFANFLLHILRIQVNQDTRIAEKVKNIPLDDKRLLELFKPFLKNKNKKEFVKKFGYNLLKGKFYFDKYIIKREFTQGTDRWSLKRLKLYDRNNADYINTFDADNAENNKDLNKEILMLLSMFHVSSPTLVYKHWLNAALKFVIEYSGDEAELGIKYKEYLENLANAFLFDRFLAKDPKDYFEIIYKNDCNPQKTINDIDFNKFHQGTYVENFIFNYLDYLLWQDYRSAKNYFKIKNGEPFKDERIEKFEFTFRSSVEHYYPVNPISGNKLKNENLINHFGNLCLISSSKNSRLSNYMPEAKKDHYKNSPTIDSIKQRIMMEYDEWGEAQIIEHENKMIELLKKQIIEH